VGQVGIGSYNDSAYFDDVDIDGTPAAPAVVVTVSPSTATVTVSTTRQFSASVTGSEDKTVAWTVDEGNDCGTISGTGLYTAPAAPRTGCHVTATSNADNTKSDTADVTVQDVTIPSGDYPFQGFTTTRGAFQAMEDISTNPRILIVDRLSGSTSDGNETTGYGSLPWALSRSYPRVILFEISGTIDVGGSLEVSDPYVSVHGQTAPSPGITLYNVEFLIVTHDVIVQHLRVRMGDTKISGGDSMGLCGATGDTVHDVIIDHCSVEFGHDEQLSISACGAGDVGGVTLSNNIIGLGLNYAGHAYGTLLDSGNDNNYNIDEILINRNLFVNVSDRTPLINPAVRSLAVTNNVTYNAWWCGLQFQTEQYPEGMLVDIMHNLYWRGPETMDIGTWPTAEVSTWPAEPDLWPASWNSNRRPTSSFDGPVGSNSHVYYLNNYDYVNNDSYTDGNHEGRPVRLEYERFYSGRLTVGDIEESTRQTSVVVDLLTPAQVETSVQLDVGCTPYDRDAVDALAVSQAFGRTGGYIDYVSDLGVPAYPTTTDTRLLTAIGGYPTGTELNVSVAGGLTDLEKWIYGL
jgi:hypothetical protein